jgi:hypothetical protein
VCHGSCPDLENEVDTSDENIDQPMEFPERAVILSGPQRWIVCWLQSKTSCHAAMAMAGESIRVPVPSQTEAIIQS